MNTSTDKESDGKKQTRRSPRNHALLAAKKKMQQQAIKERGQYLLRDDYDAAQEAKNMIRGKTGVVYDDLMAQHYCMWDKEYPECPERYLAVKDR